VNFSASLWHKINPIYEKIMRHSFNVELGSGTLNKKRFDFYMQQDTFYLIEICKALALIAGRSQNAKVMSSFLDFSLHALFAERRIHKYFLRHTHHNTLYLGPSPACRTYTRYLIATASSASLEEAAAAILPRFWINRELGKYLQQQTIKNNPYSNWIRTYSSPQYAKQVDQAILIIDDIASRSTSSMHSRMTHAFEHTSQLEWHFWNDAYEMRLFKEISSIRPVTD